MHRRQLLALTSSSLATTVAGCVSEWSDPETNTTTPQNGSDPGNQTKSGNDGLENASFEDGLTGWTVGTDLPADPGNKDEKVDHKAEIRSQESVDGDQSLYLFLEGTADDGTVWVEQQIDFSGVDEVSVDVYSEKKSFNIITNVAFFAGEKPDDGLQERDFNREEDVQDHEGWKTYTYDVSDVDGKRTLAVGMNIVWETGYGTFYDNIRVQ